MRGSLLLTATALFAFATCSYAMHPNVQGTVRDADEWHTYLQYELGMTDGDRDRWADKGWVDLRPENFARWQQRLQAMQDGRPGKAQPGSAGVTVETTVADAIQTGTVVAWILANELGGYRIK